MDAPPIQYVTTSDGYNIAYAIKGRGRPLVLIPEPVSNIHTFWREPTYMLAWYEALAECFLLVAYDGRGQGMSRRGLTTQHSSSDELRDLEAIVDRLGLEDFVLLSRTHVGVRYAWLHPERVKALVLSAMPASGSSWPLTWATDLARDNWDLFLETLAGLPNAGSDRAPGVARLKQTITQADWLARQRALAESDVRDVLSSLRVPTLVLHPREYRVIPSDESVRVAGLIPGARMVLIEGRSGRGDPGQGIKAVLDFLDEFPRRETLVSAIEGKGRLSSRECDVLRLLAVGRSNQQIADELVISLNTVRRHVSNVFDKTGVANRTEAAVYARDHGIA